MTGKVLFMAALILGFGGFIYYEHGYHIDQEALLSEYPALSNNKPYLIESRIWHDGRIINSSFDGVDSLSGPIYDSIVCLRKMQLENAVRNLKGATSIDAKCQ